MSVSCDYCDGKIEGTVYHCDECEDFDLCKPCHKKNAEVDGHKKWHNMSIRESKFGCNYCDKRIFGSKYQCRSCPNYDLCKDCYKIGAKNEAHKTSHPMAKLTIDEDKPRRSGLALIINNYEFDDPKNNFDSEGEDCEMLKDVLKGIGYDVLFYENISMSAMNAAVNNTKSKILESHDALIVVLASHGTQVNNVPVVIGTDGKHISVKDIINVFNNANCPKCRGKPKMFFIDACRGGGEDGIKFGRSVGIASRNSQGSSHNSPVGSQLNSIYSNIIVVSATIPGFVSWSLNEGLIRGGIFTIALAKTIDKYYCSWNIRKIIDKAKEKVAKACTKLKIMQTVFVEEFGWERKDSKFKLQEGEEEDDEYNLNLSVNNLVALYKEMELNDH